MKRGRGRPKTMLDEEKVRDYARVGSSMRDIALIMGCAEQVIRRRYKKVVALARAERRAALHKMQWDAAKSLNPALLIFLGKNELEQSDKVQHTGTDGGPIDHEVKHVFDHDRFAELYRSRTRGNRTQQGAVSGNGNGKSVHPDSAD